MSTILETIVSYKKQEVDRQKGAVPVRELERSVYFGRPTNSLKQALHASGKTGIIAEFKRKSPSKGLFNELSQVKEVSAGYAKDGASGLSILTDANFFGGSQQDLLEGRAANPAVPILRKDFVIDEYQIIEAKAIGADVILLICECLRRTEIQALASVARSLGMEVLLEMHTRRHLDKVVEGISMVGINNRDLKTFQVDLNRSMELAGEIADSLPTIAESGIGSPGIMKLLSQAGFDGFLIGEQFMKQEDPVKAFEEFVREYRLIEGLSGSSATDQI